MASESEWQHLRETADTFAAGGGTPEALLAALRAVGDDPSPALAHARETVGDLLRGRGLMGPAADGYRAALETHNALPLTDPAAVARLLVSLAETCETLGAEEDASLCLEQAIPLLERIHGPAHSALPALMNNAGILQRHLGDYPKSEAWFTRALGALESRFGPDHRELAPVLNNHALLCADQGDTARAESLHRRALSIREREFGPKHPDVAQSLANLAAVHVQTGHRAEACDLYARAFVILKSQAIVDPAELGTVTRNYLALLRSTGQHERADEVARRNGLHKAGA